MSKVLSLVFHPDDRLRQIAKEIKQNQFSEYFDLAQDMAKTMVADKGIGLAAPQIGQNLRLIIISTKQGAQVMINPKISKASFLKEWGEEGCLSIPKVFGDVKRHRSVECTFFDLEGIKQTATAEGLLARVIQHEIDHLNGILFIDKAKNIRQE
jgi:peptide deformylase